MKGFLRRPHYPAAAASLILRVLDPGYQSPAAASRVTFGVRRRRVVAFRIAAL